MPKGGNGVHASMHASSWERQVLQLEQKEGLPRGKARDRVILETLGRGDCKPLAALLIDGHVPAPNVRVMLALMLLDNAEAEAAIARHELGPELWQSPHALVMKSRSRKLKRADKPQRIDERPRDAGHLMPDLGYEAAIARMDIAAQPIRALTVPAPAPARRTGARKRK
jgi:hypothetical protein